MSTYLKNFHPLHHGLTCYDAMHCILFGFVLPSMCICGGMNDEVDEGDVFILFVTLPYQGLTSHHNTQSCIHPTESGRWLHSLLDTCVYSGMTIIIVVRAKIGGTLKG